MSEPLVPPPDDKNWTWATTTPCTDCGFDPGSVTRDRVPELIRTYAGALRAALGTATAAQRPRPAVWSPTEYGCHVRDVCRLFGQRLDLMRTQDDPRFANWDQDETAVQQRYWAQDPATVSGQLETEAGTLAATFGTVDGDEWQRPGRRSDGSVFTIDTFARYLLHDLAHHAWDVRCAAA